MDLCRYLARTYRFLTSIVVQTDPPSIRVSVRGAIQPVHPFDSAQLAPTRLEEPRYSARIRLWPTLVPQLLFRERGLGRRCVYVRFLGRYVAAISQP
jgi:hypothetical protein